MADLKKFMTDHLDEFSSEEPEQGHFKRFEARLASQSEVKHRFPRRSYLLKIAASIVLLIGVSVFIFDVATREIRSRLANVRQETELPDEISEAVQYYDNQANSQIATIHRLLANHIDGGSLNASTAREIQNLDATTEELKRSLAESPGNQRILEAIVQNQQMKETMLNNIINQLSRYKN